MEFLWLDWARRRAKKLKTLLIKEMKKYDVQPGYPTYNGWKRLKLEKKPGAQPGVTWCNRYVMRVLIRSGWEQSLFTDHPKGPGYTNANRICRVIEKNAKREKLVEIAERYSQVLANLGVPVVGIWGNPNGIGHVAMVCPGEYDPVKGPLLANVGGHVGLFRQRSKKAFGERWVKYYAKEMVSGR